MVGNNCGNCHRQDFFRDGSAEGSNDFMEEAPAGITPYDLELLLFPEASAELQQRRFYIQGQSFAVPEYYSQWERWMSDEGVERTIGVVTYISRSDEIARRIVESYLQLEKGFVQYMEVEWKARDDLADLWNVEEFWIVEGHPWALIRKDHRVWYMEGPIGAIEINRWKQDPYPDFNDPLIKEELIPSLEG